MPGSLDDVFAKYEPVRRSWQRAFEMSAEDCSQLCRWALKNGSLPEAYTRQYLLSARNWVAYCTSHAERQDRRYQLPDGRPNCGFFFGREHDRHMKLILFWAWLAEEKKRGGERPAATSRSARPGWTVARPS